MDPGDPQQPTVVPDSSLEPPSAQMICCFSPSQQILSTECGIHTKLLLPTSCGVPFSWFEGPARYHLAGSPDSAGPFPLPGDVPRHDVDLGGQHAWPFSSLTSPAIPQLALEKFGHCPNTVFPTAQLHPEQHSAALGLLSPFCSQKRRVSPRGTLIFPRACPNGATCDHGHHFPQQLIKPRTNMHFCFV